MKILDAKDVVKAIDDGYASIPAHTPRDYIGASLVGEDCLARLAFSLRAYPQDKPPPQLQRIFNFGHLLEDFVVNDLKKRADVRVWETDGLTGKQYAYSELGGHLVCHMDGHIELDDGVVRVLEIKSMNDASFKKFMKSGVKISHPRYYAQVQMMMAMSSIGEAFFIAINKNNSAYHAEIVESDDLEISFLKQKVTKVLNNEAEKISDNPTDWRCKGCFHRSVCWEELEHKTCTGCAHAQPNAKGLWTCGKTGEEAVDVCHMFEPYKPREKL